MHLNDFSSIAFYLKNHSIPKSKFWKILFENTTIILHKIDKLRLQILEILNIKKLERILNKLFRQNLSLLFNEIYIYIYIYMNSLSKNY